MHPEAGGKAPNPVSRHELLPTPVDVPGRREDVIPVVLVIVNDVHPSNGEVATVVLGSGPEALRAVAVTFFVAFVEPHAVPVLMVICARVAHPRVAQLHLEPERARASRRLEVRTNAGVVVHAAEAFAPVELFVSRAGLEVLAVHADAIPACAGSLGVDLQGIRRITVGSDAGASTPTTTASLALAVALVAFVAGSAVAVAAAAVTIVVLVALAARAVVTRATVTVPIATVVVRSVVVAPTTVAVLVACAVGVAATVIVVRRVVATAPVARAVLVVVAVAVTIALPRGATAVVVVAHVVRRAVLIRVAVAVAAAVRPAVLPVVAVLFVVTVTVPIAVVAVVELARVVHADLVAAAVAILFARRPAELGGVLVAADGHRNEKERHRRSDHGSPESLLHVVLPDELGVVDRPVRRGRVHNGPQKRPRTLAKKAVFVNPTNPSHFKQKTSV